MSEGVGELKWACPLCSFMGSLGYGELSLDYLMSERYFEPFVIDSYFEKRTSRLYFLYWDRILKSRGKEFICLPSKNAVLLRNSIEHRKGNEYMYMCVFNEFKIVKVKIVFYK